MVKTELKLNRPGYTSIDPRIIARVNSWWIQRVRYGGEKSFGHVQFFTRISMPY
jgi:hypothetical protein